MATYLVDLENTGLAGLSGLEELSVKDKVIVFYGTRTGSIAFDKHVELTKAKADVTYTKTERVAKNYLDFQLVTYLGYLIGSGQERVYYIISKDKGYDSCIEFWRKTDKQITITRCESLQRQKTAAQASQPGAGKSAQTAAQAGGGKSAQTAAQAGAGKSAQTASQAGGGKNAQTAAQAGGGKSAQTASQPGTDKSAQAASQTAAAESEQPEGKKEPALETITAEQSEGVKTHSEQTLSENAASGKKASGQKGSGKAALPESMRKKIRKAVKDENLKGGSYARLYDYVVRFSDKHELNVALVKDFRQEKGNRLYKEILDVFVEYQKQKAEHAPS